jgi:trans-2,3-dihydro-3-hydroxyanthranilate isomerase
MHVRYKFHIVDVFSASPFGGNQLAILPRAAGITSEGMQAIAREFNFAETTFVLPAADPSQTCQVRIFTPKAELPFAGHPTIGTACALVQGKYVKNGVGRDLILVEGIGPVRVRVTTEAGAIRAKLTLHVEPEQHIEAEQPPFALKKADIAAVLALPGADVVGGFFATVGVPFCFVHLRSRRAVDGAKIERSVWSKVMPGSWSNIYLFAGELADGSELYARMFAPALGIEEDPATGSAGAALIGVLAGRESRADGVFSHSILQGVAMGRRSAILAEATKVNGELTSVSVAGATSFMAEGEIDVPASALERGRN